MQGSLLLPGGEASVRRDQTALRADAGFNRLILQGIQIHTDDRAVQVQVELLVVVHVGRLSQLRLQSRKGTIAFYKKPLLHRIGQGVVGVERDSRLALMAAPVHVAVHQKIHAARLVHIQDPDRVLIEASPQIVSLPEAEHQRQLILRRVVAPELPVLHEADDVLFLVFPVLHLGIQNSQIDGFLREHGRIRFKNPIHPPLIIQQIHPLLRIPDPEGLRHLIALRLFLLVCIIQLVLQADRGDGVLNLRNVGPDLSLRRLHLHIGPDHLVITGMDGYIVKGIVVRRRIRLHVLGDADRIVLIEKRAVYRVHQLQALHKMRPAHIGDMRIVVRLPALLQGKAQRQQVFSSVLQKIHQLEIRPDRVSFPGKFQLPVFNQAVHVKASDLIVNVLDSRIRAFDPKGYFPVLRKRQDRVPDAGGVHALRISVHEVKRTPALLQINQRKRGGSHMGCRVRVPCHQVIAHSQDAQKEGSRYRYNSQNQFFQRLSPPFSPVNSFSAASFPAFSSLLLRRVSAGVANSPAARSLASVRSACRACAQRS